MTNYIDIVLTKNGVFCVAPAWVVKEGDLVCLTNGAGKTEIQEVVAVSTDEKGGDHIKLVEKYIGYPLPRVTAKYTKHEIDWGDEDAVSER